MGEVYRARDTRVGREVAIKILPEEFARDEDRCGVSGRKLARSRRSTIPMSFPFTTQASRMEFLISSAQLLEGESLRQRLEQGPIPARKAIEMRARWQMGWRRARGRRAPRSQA